MRANLTVWLTLFGILAPSTGFSSVITFDDIFVPATPNSYIPVPHGYQGFNWSNFDAFNASPAAGNPPSGYGAGVVSESNVAFNSSGSPANFTSSIPFTFVSGYFTGAWNDGLSIKIEGLSGAFVVDSTTVVVNATAPSFLTFNWTDLTEVAFVSSGGVMDPAYNLLGEGGSQFVLDNIDVVTNPAIPEPGTAMLLGAGLAGVSWLGLVQRRPRRL